MTNGFHHENGSTKTAEKQKEAKAAKKQAAKRPQQKKK
jgi:hypothetical protein